MITVETLWAGGIVLSAASGTVWWYVRRMFTKLDGLAAADVNMREDISVLSREKLDREEFENTMERFDNTLKDTAKDLNNSVKTAETNTTQRIDKLYTNLLDHMNK